MDTIYDAMVKLDTAAMNGALVSLTELREVLRKRYPTKEAFDAAIIELIMTRPDTYAVHRHTHTSTLTEAELNNLVKHRGPWGVNYYVGISRR